MDRNGPEVTCLEQVRFLSLDSEENGSSEATDHWSSRWKVCRHLVCQMNGSSHDCLYWSGKVVREYSTDDDGLFWVVRASSGKEEHEIISFAGGYVGRKKEELFGEYVARREADANKDAAWCIPVVMPGALSVWDGEGVGREVRWVFLQCYGSIWIQSYLILTVNPDRGEYRREEGRKTAQAVDEKCPVEGVPT